MAACPRPPASCPRFRRPAPCVARRVSLAAALVFLAAAPAVAQSSAAVAVGLSFVSVNPTQPDAESDYGPGALFRLRGSPGLGPSVGFTWFSTNVRTTIAGDRTYLGKINLKPVMAGVAYGTRLGGVETDFSLEAGYSFNNVRDTGLARRTYASRLGATGISFHVSDSFAWKADVSFWFELGKNYGLLASVGYVGVRPGVTTASSVGTTRQTVNLGSVVTAVGVTYAVF